MSVNLANAVVKKAQRSLVDCIDPGALCVNCDFHQTVIRACRSASLTEAILQTEIGARSDSSLLIYLAHLCRQHALAVVIAAQVQKLTQSAF